MTARVITDYYGSSIAVPDTCPNQFGDGGANSHVVLFTAARDAASTTHYLTRAQSDELIDALIERNQEIDAAALTEQATSDTRSPAPPVAEDRATAAGPSTPTAEPGRPISHHDGPDGVWCAWSGCTSRTGACPEGHELPGYVEHASPTPVAGPPTDGTWFTVTNAMGEKFEARVVDVDDETGFLTLEFDDGERDLLTPGTLAKIYTPAAGSAVAR
jgi:hypothetical protein